MATNADALKKYFAGLDAAEEADAAAAGMTPDELRALRQEPQNVKETRRAERYAQDINKAYQAINDPRSFTSTEVKDLGLLETGKTTIPTSMQQPKTQASPVSRAAVGFEERAGRQLRYPIDTVDLEPVPSLSTPSGVPAKTTDFASLQKLLSPGALKAPEARPIPVANAPSGSDAAAPVTLALPSVGPQNPAGPADSSGQVSLPAPSSEGAGADALGRLSLGQALTRALEGSGSIIAGRDLRSGAADTLGERMKQIEALRAKREEQSLEQQRERATWGASNRATLASNLAQWKGDEAKTAALEALAAGADTTKPSDYSRNIVNAVMTKPKVLGAEAGVAKTEAGTTRTLSQVATDEALRPGKVEKLQTGADLDRARIDKIYNDMELEGTKIALDERKTIDAATKEKDPFKKLEKLNAIADKKDFGGFTTLAGDLSDLERIAPGFVTRGVVPAWLTAEQQLLGENWPRSTNPKVIDFLAAYGKLANEERHRQYGSAQTDGELRSFMQQLNASPLSAGPAVLAKQVKRFGQAAGRVAKGRISRYNGVFGADNVNTVLAPEWKPLFAEGGVFAAQGTPFVEAPAAPAATIPAGMVKIKHSSVRTTTVDRATADRMLKDDPANFSEVK